MDPARLCLLLEERLDREVSPRRAAHARAVAGLAARLCAARGIEEARGRAAGLAHDLLKEAPPARQAELAASWEGPGPASARTFPKAMHGPAAAALLRAEYGVEDAGLLDAVASHTFGRPGMGDLAIILYCADKTEPGRGRSATGGGELLLGLDCEAMLRLTVEETVAWLEARGYEIAPETRLLYNSLLGTVARP